MRFFGSRSQVLVDVAQQAPMGQFAGIFELEQAGRTSPADDKNQNRTFPIFVNRRSGEAMMFSGDQWQDFVLWLASF